eukprot:TRINITY_DN14762_c0_g1_i2.p1 TRINITY_DN14762_c0_g1~~TRINITY_DN14762_c0_g1_i2.p1  ORF type:complete len:194 (+),score=41.99 TRINITY_DN14762_c0_g1_i2:97-678(+)
MGGMGSRLDKSKLRELEKKTKKKFGRDELEEWYTIFHENYPRDKFPEGMPKDTFIQENMEAHGGDEALWEYLFKRISNNKDSITFDEFIDHMAIGTRGTSEEKLQWTFKFYDKDNNGYIDHHEMLAIFQSIFKMVEAVELAQQMPADQNTPEKRVKCIFDKMDIDQDRRLSMEEFTEGCKADNTIMEVMSLMR